MGIRAEVILIVTGVFIGSVVSLLTTWLNHYMDERKDRRADMVAAEQELANTLAQILGIEYGYNADIGMEELRKLLEEKGEALGAAGQLRAIAAYSQELLKHKMPLPPKREKSQ